MTLRSRLVTSARTASRKMGADIVRYPTLRTEGQRLARLLRTHQIDVVLDVGANVGQYAAGIRRAGFTGRIVSFEPLPQAFAELTRRCAADPTWSAVAVALGKERGHVELNVAGNSTSSSVLPMLARHVAAAPRSAYTTVCTVPIETLDAVFAEHVSPTERGLLKIDTQGYEHEVLRGATQSLDKILGLQLEMSLEPLYEGQVLFREMLQWVYERGFRLAALEPGFSDEATGQMLQMDGVFFRLAQGE